MPLVNIQQWKDGYDWRQHERAIEGRTAAAFQVRCSARWIGTPENKWFVKGIQDVRFAFFYLLFIHHQFRSLS